MTTSPADASAADAAPAPAEAVAASKPPADDASGLDAEADDVRATARSIADAAVASALEVSAETPEAGSDASTAPENSNAHLEEVLAADAAEWATLNAAGCAPFAGAQWTVGFIADQDEASASEAADGSKLYESTFSLGSLSYDVEAKAYTLGALNHSVVATKRGDKAGRGAEFSALEVLGARLLTFDDRTGAVDEIVKEGDGFAVQPLLDGAGEEVVCSLGDGSRPGKGLKCEWATLRDGALVVGSTGKERTDDEGNIVHEGEMWCKAINPETLAVTSVDARPLYNALRAKAKCPQGKGYMIHESGRWSDVHLRWFFMPRKLSREPYDEVRDASKCVSLLLAANGRWCRGDVHRAVAGARAVLPSAAWRVGLLLHSQHERHPPVHHPHGGDAGQRGHDLRVCDRPCRQRAHGGARDRQRLQIRGRMRVGWLAERRGVRSARMHLPGHVALSCNARISVRAPRQCNQSQMFTPISREVPSRLRRLRPGRQ